MIGAPVRSMPMIRICSNKPYLESDEFTAVMNYNFAFARNYGDINFGHIGY